ncbi:DUF2807 domain-containing protein [Lutibacter sp. A80]|uniref:head GIN domain-containing protein n=1 Tax=Lutibacter sp. A80 TaxID=2918453 RepID=UPI001F05C1F7|nr:head GIN domain-containing protein [Lutibacter sp. A80]UMB59542.1 DUF2807 domain-containing protein [Lutibacter sp. A80]
MKKLTLLLVFISTITFSQEKIITKIGDFNTLKVYNGLTVELKKGTTSKVEITGSQSKDVSIKNSNGILKIRLHFPDSFTAEDVKIVLYYNKNIDVLDANEGGTIISDEIIEQQLLEVKVQEGAKIYLDVNTKHLTVKAVSGGIIELNGVTENQNIEATTGGIYEGYDLQSKQAIVISASGATAEVNASEILDAKVRFGGNIYYIGTPETLKTKKVIGGVIKDKN